MTCRHCEGRAQSAMLHILRWHVEMRRADSVIELLHVVHYLGQLFVVNVQLNLNIGGCRHVRHDHAVKLALSALFEQFVRIHIVDSLILNKFGLKESSLLTSFLNIFYF